MNREDFDILSDNKIKYFDNGATTLKPKQVINGITDYYTKYTANAHRGDYDMSLKVDEKYENVRTKVKELINANHDNEIIYTSGTTESLNYVVFGFMKEYLKAGDEILLTKAEHASNILNWLKLQEEIGCVVKYIPLDEDYHVTIDNVRQMINENTKVISIAHITNVIGDIRPINEIGHLCKEKEIIFVVDAAQSIGHISIDVQKSNIDFLAFSAHKMVGPTGIGVLYGKYELLERIKPLKYGGGMNSFFEACGEVELKDLPERLEAGTPNIAGVIGMGCAIDYIKEIGLDNIHKYEIELKKYAIEKMKKIPNIIVYNEKANSGIIVFNIKDIFSQDTGIFLNKYNICVRSGNHCAKILKDELKVTNTCRASLYFYNTKEEIDALIEALNKQNTIFDDII